MALRLRIAQNIQYASQRLMARFDRGLGPSLVKFSGDRAADLSIIDVQQLPVRVETRELVDVFGNFYFITGYSAVGGPDVLA